MLIPPMPAPTALDRIIAAVAPGAAVRRLHARAQLAIAGAYSAVRGDNRALKGWSTTQGSADAESLADLATLRRQSSDLRRNTPLATGAFRTLRNGIVGLGIRPQPRIDRELLGLSEEEAARWEGDVVRLWSWWAETTACDAAGRLDFYGLQALALWSKLERGDAIAIRRFKSDQRRALGLAIQLLEGDYLENPSRVQDDERRKGGIEFNEFGEPVAYWLATRHPADNWRGGIQDWHRVLAIGPESGEPQVLHLFDPQRAGQSRGVPLLASAIEPLKQLGTYTNAELGAAVLASFFTVFVKQESQFPSGFNAEAVGSTQFPLAANEVALGQGAVVNLGPGETIETANPTRPNAQFAPFIEAIAMQFGAAIGLPYEIVLQRFNASYSASRAAWLVAWQGYYIARRDLIAQLCRPVYDWLIAEAVARGRLTAPGFFDDPLVRRAWTDATWTGDAPGQIDEESAVQAAVARIDAGLSTLEEETTRLTGGDWEQNHAQQVKERRARVAAGLDVEPVAERVVTQPQEPVRSPDGPDPAPAGDGRTPSQAKRATRRLSLAVQDRARDGVPV